VGERTKKKSFLFDPILVFQYQARTFNSSRPANRTPGARIEAVQC
jgi:hypothetical protein